MGNPNFVDYDNRPSGLFFEKKGVSEVTPFFPTLMVFISSFRDDCLTKFTIDLQPLNPELRTCERLLNFYLKLRGENVTLRLNFFGFYLTYNYNFLKIMNVAYTLRRFLSGSFMF